MVRIIDESDSVEYFIACEYCGTKLAFTLKDVSYYSNGAEDDSFQCGSCIQCPACRNQLNVVIDCDVSKNFVS